MNKMIVFGLVVMLIFVSGCVGTINSFDDCIKAGNPAMESYPRKCAANGEVFIEELDEPIVGGCGTVTPGYNDECCANANKDVLHPACVGEWKWTMPEARCKFVCTTSEMVQEREDKIATTEFIKCEDDDEKQSFITCSTDLDCHMNTLRTECSDLQIPNCPPENFCVEGLCKFNCD